MFKNRDDLQGRIWIGLCGSPDIYANRISPFLVSLAGEFAHAHGVANWALLSDEAVFHPIEFDNPGYLPLSFFYEAFFDDLVSSAGTKSDFRRRIGFCLDNRACPNVCSVTGRHFARYSLGDVEIAYMLHVSVDEIFQIALRGPAE